MSARIRIDGKEYDVPTNYTLGEARVIKRFTGMTLDEFDAASPSDPDVIAALVFVALRRDNPDFREEDVDGIKLVDLEPVEAEDDARPPDDPPSANGASASESSSPETAASPVISGTPPSDTSSE